MMKIREKSERNPYDKVIEFSWKRTTSVAGIAQLVSVSPSVQEALVLFSVPDPAFLFCLLSFMCNFN